jgi:hypothetical protein
LKPDRSSNLLTLEARTIQFSIRGGIVHSISRREFVMSSGALVAAPLIPTRAGEGPRPGLFDSLTPEKLASLLLARENWKPFPPVADRTGWERIEPDAKANLIETGARRLGTPWEPLPATLFLEYRRNGNRSNYERARNVRRERLASLVLAECAENQGRFLDEIANGIWTTCEETFWGVPAHLNMQKAGPGLPDADEPVVDLFAAETSSLLAWTDYLLGPHLDSVSPLIRPRIRLEAERRLLTPCLARNDFWWMGLDPSQSRDLNNWTPWIVSNWLATALLLESNSSERIAAVHKSLRSLDRFLAAYHEDGGCDEGPGYWFRAGGSLFDCLELLHSASSGAINFYEVPLIREVGRYIYRAHIHDNYFINFADAAAKLRIAGDLVFRYGSRIGDPRMQAFGAWAAEKDGRLPASGESIGRTLPALFNLAALKAAPRSQPLPRDVWLPGIQVMAARRKEGSAEGLYLAAQGGHNAESHNHNDVGNFIVYADGQPVIVDVGVETYTAKTFSSQRYEIWTMQSAYHNLPTIDGVMQSAGRRFAARDAVCRADDRSAQFTLEIAGAYPPEAGLGSWKRDLRLDRERNEVEVKDSFALIRNAGRVAQTLMTPWKAQKAEPGELLLETGPLPSGRVRIAYDATMLSPEVEEMKIEDGRLRSSWGDRLYRILLTATSPANRGSWTLRIVQG